MTEKKHTALPWILGHDGTDIGCPSHPICDLTRGEWGDYFPSIRLVGETSLDIKAEAFMDGLPYGCVPVEESKANAEFIVRACNSHYELLEALEDLANDCEGWVDAEYKDDGEVYHPALQRKYDRDMETVLKARALIAKARGETDVT